MTINNLQEIDIIADGSEINIQDIVKRTRDIGKKAKQINEAWAADLGYKQNAIKNFLIKTKLTPKILREWIQKSGDPLNLIDNKLGILLKDISDISIIISRLLITMNKEIEILETDLKTFSNNPDMDVMELKAYIARLSKIPLPPITDGAELHSDRDDKNRKELLNAISSVLKLKKSIGDYVRLTLSVCAELQQKGTIQKAQLVTMKSPLMALKDAATSMSSLSTCTLDVAALTKETMEYVNDAMKLIMVSTKFAETQYLGRPETVENIKNYTAEVSAGYEKLFGKGSFGKATEIQAKS
jgi:hypothetical protein